MPPEEINFQTFFAAKIKDHGVSIKKLSETTGIAPAHLESMAHGNFDSLPAAPYVHGYVVRLGKVLGFDGEMCWEKIQKEGLMKNSGPADRLPSNRFLKQSPAKFIWIGAVAVIIVIYLALQLPIIFGKPGISISAPSQNPVTTTSTTFTIEGTVRGADSLSLNGDTIAINKDGVWQKTVLLQNGPNSFQISAKKLLGGEADVTLQIIYQASATLSGTTASSTAPTSTTSTASGT